MHLIFFKTNDVFKAEEQLINSGNEVEIVPTPVQDKAYCGVCIEIENSKIEIANSILSNLEYKVIEWVRCI